MGTRSRKRITIAPNTKTTIMLGDVKLDKKGIHGYPSDSGMGTEPGIGAKLPMELVYVKGEGYVSAPSFTPSGVPIGGAMCVLIEDGVVSAAYTHRREA